MWESPEKTIPIVQVPSTGRLSGFWVDAHLGVQFRGVAGADHTGSYTAQCAFLGRFDWVIAKQRLLFEALEKGTANNEKARQRRANSLILLSNLGCGDRI